MSSFTAPYPDNDRSEWVVVPLDVPYRDGYGLLCWSYMVYANLTASQTGYPFLFNSHKAQIRQTHQRKSTSPDGRLIHVSGALVSKADQWDFLANDEKDAYRWVERWKDDKGRSLAPIMFPTYRRALRLKGGATEEFDPQWPRDHVTIPAAGQRSALQESYLQSVFDRRLSGDRRGTTLDLQVSASADDTIVITDDTILLTNAQTPYFYHTATTIGWGARFLSVTVADDATVDAAYLTYTPITTVTGISKSVVLAADDADDAATFSTAADWVGRARTTATTSFVVPSQTANVEINTDSLVDEVQEVVDRAGWASGNALAILQNTSTAGTENPTAHSYDSDTSKAPKLHIEYTEQLIPISDHVVQGAKQPAQISTDVVAY